MFPGVDIIEIDRFGKACQRHPRLVQRLFTPKELEYQQGKNYASLAARFAGKEAILKALGTGLQGVSWHDIEIINNELGEPIVFLSDVAAGIAKQRGGNMVRVSLSHSRDYAIAMAVLV